MKKKQVDELYQWIVSLAAGVDALKSLGSSQITFHLESQSDNTEYLSKSFPSKARIIWSNTDDTLYFIHWLLAVNEPISIAKINRNQKLYCVEIIFLKNNLEPTADGSQLSINLNQFQHFLGHNGFDVFSYTKPLALLNSMGVLVMDMDSTAIEIECIDEIAKRAGVGEAVAVVTEKAMMGELDFEQSLRQRVAALKGADASIITDLCSNLPLMSGLESMIKELQSYGWKIVLASGGFRPFVDHLKTQLGLTAAYANHLVIEKERLTGELSGDIVDADFKANVLNLVADKYHIPFEQRVAIGDGANDIPLINMAYFGIAFHGKEKVKNAADACINKLDLRVLPYYLQKTNG